MNDVTATATLTRAQVLDKLEDLARAEHALIVEYLTVSCALGHNLLAEEDGATSEEGREAASTAASLAQNEMFHLKDICRALVTAERSPDLGRASSITDASGGQVSLDPPSVEAGAAHGEGTSRLHDALGDPPPPDFLRVPRRETSDSFEQDLLRASDLAYRLVTSALRDQFAQPDVFSFRSLATTAMDALDASNRALARRGLLPAFNP